MAAVAVLYRPKLGSIAKTGTVLDNVSGTLVDSVVFDAVVNEAHSGEVQVTDNPVERGVDVTDNIRPKPEQITLDVIVSNSPLRQTLDGNPDNPKRASEAFRVLRELRDGGVLVSVVTGLRSYDSMVIQKIDVSRNVKTGQVLSAKIALRQILIADTATVPAPIKPSGEKKKSDGKKPSKEASAKQDAAARKSVAKKLVSFLSGG